MNKLTITDKVFVPRNANDSALIHYTKKVYDTSPNGFKLISDVKEETNKYVLSREELEKVISDAYTKGWSNTFSTNEVQQYIKKLLNNE
jgi:hypothetical protein